MITSTKYLSYLLKVRFDDLEEIINNVDDYYLSWESPKKNKITGEILLDTNNNVITRPINSTRGKLKVIQKRLYKILLSYFTLPKYAFGGVPKKDNVLNAKYHQGNKYIFTTDLKSFFPSISNQLVFNFFIRNGFSPTVSKLLTHLTTYKHKLPQGVPTSSFLANLIFKSTGDKILEFAEKHELKFSIFVDDITVSSKYDFKDIIPEILRIITDDGYIISHKKTHYKTKNPVITGIICQNNKIKLQPYYYKKISWLSKNSEVNNPRRLKGALQYKRRIDIINES